MTFKAIWSTTAALAILPMMAQSQIVTVPSPETDPGLMQLRMAEIETLEARKEGAKKPPREVRKQKRDAAMGSKKSPKKPAT